MGNENAVRRLWNLAAIAVVVAFLPGLLRAAAPKPNVILIVADDLGWADLGVYGSTFYETPNLDRLASRGVRFTSAYAAAPVCSPTRASLLTGKYPARVGVTDYIPGAAAGKLLPAPYTQQLPLEEFNLAEAMKAAGYATWHVGKWHLGREQFYPERQGFDVNVAGSFVGSPRKTYFSPYNIPNLADGPEGEYLTDRITDEAIRLIEKQQPDRPFFLNLWHYAPHTPIQAPAALVEKYKAKAKRLGLGADGELKAGEMHPIENKRGVPVKRRLVQSDPVYAAMIENLDANVGRLLAAVERTGRADNTIVVFTSDNGGLSTSEGSPTHNGPLRDGKGWLYEGGLRVPLIIKWPGDKVPAGAIGSGVVTSADIMPTLLAMIEQPIPEGLDGKSIAMEMQSREVLVRPLFWHYPHYGNQGGTPGSAVRYGEWKLIEFFEDGRRELYDVIHDPSETNNLAAAQPARVAELYGMLTAWRASVGAKLPQPNPKHVEAAK